MTSAAAVSRKLRAGGITVVSTRNREGVRVTGSRGYVRVSVDIDSARQRHTVARCVAEILAGNGYAAERREDAETLSFTVSKRLETPNQTRQEMDKLNVSIWSHWRDETWTGKIPAADTTDEMGILEHVFRFFNRVDEGDNSRLASIGYELPSLSVLDQATIDNRTWLCADSGWEEIPAGEVRHRRRMDRRPV
jgi:hypothetical protein